MFTNLTEITSCFFLSIYYITIIMGNDKYVERWQDNELVKKVIELVVERRQGNVKSIKKKKWLEFINEDIYNIYI